MREPVANPLRTVHPDGVVDGLVYQLDVVVVDLQVHLGRVLLVDIEADFEGLPGIIRLVIDRAALLAEVTDAIESFLP